MRQRGTESWELRVFAGRDPETARKQYLTSTVKGTKKEASRELARLVVQVEDGQFSVKTGTVGDLCERWYENGEARWTARTAHGYRRILDLRIIPKFGASPLRAAGLRHAALEQGVRWGWLAAKSVRQRNSAADDEARHRPPDTR